METEIIGDITFAEDSEYNVGLRSRSIEVIDEIVSEMRAKIDALSGIEPKTFSLKSRIKSLKYRLEAIEKRYKLLADNRFKRIKKIEFNKTESEVVNYLAGVIGGNPEGFIKRDHRKKLPQAEDIGNGQFKLKGETVNNLLASKVFIEKQIEAGLDPETIDPQVIKQLDLGHLLKKNQIQIAHDENGASHVIVSEELKDQAAQQFLPKNNLLLDLGSLMEEIQETPAEIAARETRIREGIGIIETEIEKISSQLEEKAS